MLGAPHAAGFEGCGRASAGWFEGPMEAVSAAAEPRASPAVLVAVQGQSLVYNFVVVASGWVLMLLLLFVVVVVVHL